LTQLKEKTKRAQQKISDQDIENDLANEDITDLTSVTDEERAAAEEEAKGLNDEMAEAIRKGDISKLPDKLKEFSKDIVDAYTSTFNAVNNSMFEAIGGGNTEIFVSSTNKDMLAKFAEKGFLKRANGQDFNRNEKTNDIELEEDDLLQWSFENLMN